MIVDINASLGHYPFRRLRFTTAESLVALMDRNGIDKALVTPLPALFYRDAQQGNEELFAQTDPHRDRLVPVAMVNPTYVGWERDLSASVDRLRCPVVTLAPEYHGYSLMDARGRSALDRISELGLALMLTQRFEDRRQRHSWDRAEDLQVTSVLEIAAAYPRLRFLLVNWIFLDRAKLRDAGLKGRCLIDFARMHVLYRKEVTKLIEELGSEAVAFGSHMPFDYVGGSLVKLANLRLIHPAACDAIAGHNAARFLQLEI